MSNTIPIIIEETSGINRYNEPVTVGIPFPKGLLREESSLRLHDTRKGDLALQTQTLARWPDGSGKWVLLDFQVSMEANKTKELELTQVPSTTNDENPTENKAEISIKKNANSININTDAASFFINTSVFKPFDRVVIDNIDILENSSSKIVLTDESGTEYESQINNICIETEGQLRTTLKAEGEFRSSKKTSFANFFSRVSFYANSSIVKIEFTIHNPRAAKHPGGLWDLGDPGSIFFKDLSIYSTLKCYQPTAMNYELNNELSTISYQQNDETSTVNYQPSAMPAPWNTSVIPSGSNELIIYQDSSGGENWKSLNHVNRDGEVKNSFRGYRVFSNGEILKEGLRANPILSIKDKHNQISGAVRDFWQNFPKSVEVNENTLIVRLFPKQYNDLFELQGGEQKTHTFYLNYELNDKNKTGLGWVQSPLVPRTTPEWYAQSMAFGYMAQMEKDENLEYRKLVDNVINGEKTFFDLREQVDEYGWRHFGEVYAEHEKVGYKGSLNPFVSHYNNQYDIVCGCILQFARTGDLKFYELMNDLAKHVIDIDIYHTKRDRPAFSGGSFWHTDHFMHAETSTHRAFSKNNATNTSYGGGLSEENCYSTGLCNYYFLTGNIAAKDAVIELADWIMNADKMGKNILGILRRLKRIKASVLNEYFFAPARAQANSINTLLDAYELTSKKKYLLKAENIIKKYMSPSDDIDKLNKQQIEARWMYLVFLQSVGKYLDIKGSMNEQDEMYSYTRKCLIHHAKWMLKNEVPYKQLFHIIEIPSSTWPAQDIRKSAVFNYAHKYADEINKDAFKEKAEYFFNTSISDILSFEDESMTFVRPLAILMHYGVQPSSGQI